MNTLPLATFECTCDEAIGRATRTLVEAGLRVVVSFDSRHLRLEKQSEPCPHHGHSDCNCQVAILLVYGFPGEPATVLVQGQDNSTSISLATAPGVRPPPRFENKIRQLFALLPTTGG